MEIFCIRYSVSEIFKQTSILANDQFLLALKVYTYSKLRVLKLLFHCNDNNHMVLCDYWLWASSFKKIMNMYEFAICMIYFFFSTRKSTLLTGPIWPRYYEWLASLKYLWITIELFPNGCMQDKTLGNSTARWWIKCLLVVWWLDEIMTNFVLNAYTSEPKIWVNIIQHTDTYELLFSFYQSNFFVVLISHVINQSFNFIESCS